MWPGAGRLEVHGKGRDKGESAVEPRNKDDAKNLERRWMVVLGVIEDGRGRKE